MANDHYIPRFLTRPWEYRDRRLNYFDFVSGDFSDCPSKKLFAKQDLNTPGLEDLFERAVETPAGSYVSSVVNRDELVPFPDEWDSMRGIALLMFLSAMRIDAATGVKGWEQEGQGLTSRALEEGGFPLLDRIAKHFLDRFRVSAVEIPRGQSFFFSETCGFAVPLVGKPIIAVPIGLRFALLSREAAIDHEEIAQYARGGVLAALSVGVADHCRRLVLPPEWRGVASQDRQGAAVKLREIRADAQRLFDLIGQASHAIGLDGWQVGPPSKRAGRG